MEQNTNNQEETAFYKQMCVDSVKIFIKHLAAEGVDKDKLVRALKKTEPDLHTLVSAAQEKDIHIRQQQEKEKAFASQRKDHLTRFLVYYLKESDSMAKAVYFPRQSFKIFAEAIRKLLGENIIAEKQLECYAVVMDYRDENGNIIWEKVFVDERAKQITWDVFFRIGMAMAGLSGNWFKEYIVDYARTHGGFHGEGMANYVQERLESIATTFKPFR